MGYHEVVQRTIRIRGSGNGVDDGGEFGAAAGVPAEQADPAVGLVRGAGEVVDSLAEDWGEEGEQRGRWSGGDEGGGEAGEEGWEEVAGFGGWREVHGRVGHVRCCVGVGGLLGVGASPEVRGGGRVVFDGLLWRVSGATRVQRWYWAWCSVTMVVHFGCSSDSKGQRYEQTGGEERGDTKDRCLRGGAGPGRFVGILTASC